MSKLRTWWTTTDTIREVPMRAWPPGYVHEDVELGVVSEIEAWVVERIAAWHDTVARWHRKDAARQREDGDETSACAHEELAAEHEDFASSLRAGEWKTDNPKED